MIWIRKKNPLIADVNKTGGRKPAITIAFNESLV